MLPWYCNPLFKGLLWAVLCKGCVGGFATGSLELFFWKLFRKVCPFQGLGQVQSYFPLFIFFTSVAQNNSPYLVFYIQNTWQNLYHILLFFCQLTFSPLGTSHFRDWYYHHYTQCFPYITSRPQTSPGLSWHKLMSSLTKSAAAVSCSSAMPNDLTRSVFPKILTSQHQHSCQSTQAESSPQVWLPWGGQPKGMGSDTRLITTQKVH